MKKQQTPIEADFGSSLGFIILRLWLGLRTLLSGIEKFAGVKVSETPVVIDGEENPYGLVTEGGEKVYSFANYNGVPEGLYGKFLGEPLIPEFALRFYDIALGPLLILLGLTVLLGVATRTSLFLMGLVYTSLTVGLVLIGQDGGVAWLGIHIGLVAAALFFSRYNRWMLFPKF
jgi:thiosulfate dehydrogenase [quinone] large subunit